MCETLLKTRSRGRSGVPAIRLRCLSAMRVRRSFVVLIFINQLPVTSCQLPVLFQLQDWKLETGNWKLTLLPSCPPSSSALRRYSGRPSAYKDPACEGVECLPPPETWP